MVRTIIQKIDKTEAMITPETKHGIAKTIGLGVAEGVLDAAVILGTEVLIGSTLSFLFKIAKKW